MTKKDDTFLYFFSNYSWSFYSVPGTVVDDGDTEVKNKVPAFTKFHSRERDRNKSTNVHHHITSYDVKCYE